MKKISILIILFTSTVFSQNDNKEIAENIYNSTEKYGELFMAENFEELAAFATPKLIEHLESKQDFIYLLSQLTQNAKAQGVTITGVSFGQHSEIIENENELQTVVPFELKLENQEQVVEIGSGIALVSLDKGKNWHFTFQVINDKVENNRVLGLNERIIIPTRTQKVTAK